MDHCQNVINQAQNVYITHGQNANYHAQNVISHTQYMCSVLYWSRDTDGSAGQNTYGYMGPIFVWM